MYGGHAGLATAKLTRTFRDRQCWTPLVPQDVQTDRTIRVDVRMVDLRGEADLRRLEWVVGGERDGKEEHAACIG